MHSRGIAYTNIDSFRTEDIMKVPLKSLSHVLLQSYQSFHTFGLRASLSIGRVRRPEIRPSVREPMIGIREP
jgi:hypothetical protein